MEKKEKIRLAVVGAVELAIIVFCLVVAIMVLTSGYSQAASEGRAAVDNWANSHNPMVVWFCQNNIWLFFLIVLPPILLFVIDGIYLILYATKRESSLSKEEKDAIAEEARRQAKEEIMKELQQEGQGEEKKGE